MTSWNPTVYVRKPKPKNTSYDASWYHRGGRDPPNVIGKPVPLTPTFLGYHLLKMKQEPAKNRAGYYHKYPRCLETTSRRMKVVSRLRNKPLLPYPIIARICQVSSRTIWKDAQSMIRHGNLKAKNCCNARFRRSKLFKGIINSKGIFLGLKTLILRVKAFILGYFYSLEEALGEDPP